jgi:NAD(P)-dependent dehydrogenase (short-subunit alcohol dehydrogenase family)
MDLEGQVAIVTGGGRGIGRAIVLELAQMGADIVIAELDLGMAERVASEVHGLGRQALPLNVDVTRWSDLEMMVGRALERFEQIDVLVNNAGIYRAALPHEVSEGHWDAVMDVNAKAVFFASRAVLPTMMEARGGTIISVASMAGKIGSSNNAPYAASKATVISLTKSLALAYASYGIRVNCVCPGTIETDMLQEVALQAGAGILGLSHDEFRRQRLAMISLGRLGTPDDVARVVGFLASDRAGYLTGQALNVTGGIIMH